MVENTDLVPTVFVTPTQECILFGDGISAKFSCFMTAEIPSSTADRKFEHSFGISSSEYILNLQLEMSLDEIKEPPFIIVGDMHRNTGVGIVAK